MWLFLDGRAMVEVQCSCNTQRFVSYFLVHWDGWEATASTFPVGRCLAISSPWPGHLFLSKKLRCPQEVPRGTFPDAPHSCGTGCGRLVLFFPTPEYNPTLGSEGRGGGGRQRSKRFGMDPMWSLGFNHSLCSRSDHSFAKANQAFAWKFVKLVLVAHLAVVHLCVI